MVEHDNNVFKQEHDRKVAAGVSVLMLLGVGICALIFSLRPDVAVYVTGFEWDRYIFVEQYGPHDGSAWCDDGLPDGAYNVSRVREIRTYESILVDEVCEDVQADQGDGTFRTERRCSGRYRQEPVYADRCYYTIDRWDHARRVRVSGDSNADELYWPDPVLNCAGQEQHGCEREARRNEFYKLHLYKVQDDHTYTCNVDLDRWLNTSLDDRFFLEVNSYLQDPLCDSLQKLRPR